jgi:hypothetical protein
MFCRKCGTQIADDSSFCALCGTKTVGGIIGEESADGRSSEVTSDIIIEKTPENIDGYSENESVSLPEEKHKKSYSSKKFKHHKKLIIVLTIVVIVGVIVSVLLCLYRSSDSCSVQQVVKEYFKGLEKGDSKQIFLSVAPKDVMQEVKDAYCYGDGTSLKEFYSEHDRAFNIFYDVLKEQGNVKLNYKIINMENLDDLDKLTEDSAKYEISNLEDFRTSMEESLGAYDFYASRIKKAYIAKISWTISIDGERFAGVRQDIFIYKYNNDWYLINGPCLGDLFSAVHDAEYDHETYEEIEQALSSDDDVSLGGVGVLRTVLWTKWLYES